MKKSELQQIIREEIKSVLIDEGFGFGKRNKEYKKKESIDRGKKVVDRLKKSGKFFNDLIDNLNDDALSSTALYLSDGEKTSKSFKSRKDLEKYIVSKIK